MQNKFVNVTCAFDSPPLFHNPKTRRAHDLDQNRGHLQGGGKMGI